MVIAIDPELNKLSKGECERRLETFEGRIARGDKVEPTDWMPQEYRNQLIRLIHVHANSEICGALPEGKWIPHAPSFKRKMALLAKVQDEVGHAQLLYRAAETLGASREQMIEDLISGKSKFSNVFHYPAEIWTDVAIIAWLIDGAAIVNQMMMSDGSYGPYSRALKRICYEEAFHLKHGYEMVVTIAQGTKKQREMLQDSLDRWWPPIMMFHGPSDKESKHTSMLVQWGVKLKTNDEQRQQFLRQFVPKMIDLGLKIPDPGLRLDKATGDWLYTEPDWREFKRVINGGGPASGDRVATRKLAHEDGRWVREALTAAAANKPVPMPTTTA